MNNTYIPAVISARYQEDYLISVEFDDGSHKLIDFEVWLTGPIFEPLKAKPYFQSFFIEGGTIAWPNGADIAPETLYEAENVAEETAVTPTA